MPKLLIFQVATLQEMMSKPTAIVIGAGFAGMSAASFLAQNGFDVRVLEKHDHAGGRARVFRHGGFTFDMGPSWYWMPDVFERYFRSLGSEVSQHYNLLRLDPGYRVFFKENETLDVPANMKDIESLFESIEPGSSEALRKFLKDAEYKYEVGVHDLVFRPSRRIAEFADRRVVAGLVKMHLFTPFSKFIRKYFKNEKLLMLLEFPVLFLGAKPSKIPALYSLMNHADLSLGTWYPEGGMHKIVQGMQRTAEQHGVRFMFEHAVEELVITDRRISGVRTDKGTMNADVVVAGADYHFVDKHLLPEKYSNYKENYWQSRTLAPSCLLFYVGVGKKIPGLLHHNLFFDAPFEPHAAEIYDKPSWPANPLFYVSAPSVTDPTVAPEGMENLFLLMPVAPDLTDDDATHEKYWNIMMERLEERTGTSIRDAVVFKRAYSVQDFKKDYNAFKGNAYGLANTLRQTAILKPGLKNRKLDNLYYTGQLTVPGPGVPPSLISGEVVAKEIIKTFK
jgi:phytoene desaturase